MTLWKDDYRAYSQDDAKLIDEVLGDLYRRGERPRYKDREEHIYGLGAWIGKNLDRMERFIFACRNLRAALREEKVLTAKLEKQLAAMVGTTELMDLASKRGFTAFYGNLFQGFMVPNSQADALIIAINVAIDTAGRRGFSEGSSVLKRLATGDMSVVDFESEEAKKG